MSDAGDEIPVVAPEATDVVEPPKGKMSIEDALKVRTLKLCVVPPKLKQK